MTDRLDLEDLSALARREGLSSAEQQRLDLALGHSRSANVLHEAGVAFDEMDQVQAGDDQRVARLAERAAGRFAEPGVAMSRRVRGARRLGLAVAFASSLAAAGAVTALVLQETSKPDAPPQLDPPAQAATPTPPAAAATREALALEQPAEEIDQQPAEPTGEAPSVASKSRLRHAQTERSTAELDAPSQAKLPDVAEPELTAAKLFSRANAERRTGDLAAAMRSYQELQRQFAGSPQARLSHVSVGKLHLRSGSGARALEQFNAYLASGGSLTEEALQGKARALASLGRKADERRVWQQLLHRFPNSVYAQTAQRRLNDLSQ